MQAVTRETPGTERGAGEAMKLWVMSRRHSEAGGLCDVHKGYADKTELVAKVMVEDGYRIIVGVCRKCARALLGAATGKKP